MAEAECCPEPFQGSVPNPIFVAIGTEIGNSRTTSGEGTIAGPGVLFVSLWAEKLPLNAKNLPKFKKFPGIRPNSGVSRRNIW
ncbi:hypothetical protein KRR55_15815 [Paeniglutamicibacter sp. ABSL32-1]|uniref:hypothetical protein n=1 Tax=Paeniglutamicibacter quisquiliarum TaxID=2849498 RepID=UPI001C2CE3CA|nr:hypothetical protein [Paeniglutamicibacter quisquiliarum]MBV1780583.1 hypothetical protein [Paeniglutamicibacter quisquiliarum]